VFFDDFGNIIHLNALIPNPLRVNNYGGTECARAKTRRPSNCSILGQITRADGFSQLLDQVDTAF
jgi:hypothetical protein